MTSVSTRRRQRSRRVLTRSSAGRPPSQYHHGSPVASGSVEVLGQIVDRPLGLHNRRLAVAGSRRRADSLRRPWPTPPPPPRPPVPPRARSRRGSCAPASCPPATLVEASLARIDALNPELNAFVDVFHDEALAAAAAIHPGDERPFAGVPIAMKNNRAIAGRRLTYCADFMGDWPRPVRPQRRRAPARRGLRRRREHDAAGVGHPALDEHEALRRRPATRGTASARPAARRAARRPRSRPGWSRSPTPTTAAARPGSRRRAAASSASSRSATASRCPRDRPELPRDRRRPDADGRRHRGRARRSRGPEVGDAAWAPPPAEPFARRAGRAPERLRVAVTVARRSTCRSSRARPGRARGGRAARVARPRRRGGRSALAPAASRRALHRAVRAR